jgi:hypothetical protein
MIRDEAQMPDTYVADKQVSPAYDAVREGVPLRLRIAPDDAEVRLEGLFESGIGAGLPEQPFKVLRGGDARCDGRRAEASCDDPTCD